jgi:hypothetical protein
VGVNEALIVSCPKILRHEVNKEKKIISLLLNISYIKNSKLNKITGYLVSKRLNY